MNSVSFILNAATTSSDDIDSLSAKGHSLLENGVRCEYLLYGDGGNAKSAPSFVGVISSQTPTVSSFQKAIISASGSWLIFTSLANVLADIDNTIAYQAAELSGGYLAIPGAKQSKVQRIIGLHKFSEVPYLLASKNFAAAHINSSGELKSCISLANRLLSVSYINGATPALPDALLKKLVTCRPYYRILENQYRTKLREIQADRKRKRDLKLSLRVPAVPYSSHMPIFIICRDRVEPLKKLVNWLEKEGMQNIYFIDNASTYKPLLDYYNQTPHEVIRLSTNIGHTSPWHTGTVQMYAKNKPYIVTDPDIIPLDESHGAVKHFCELLTKHPDRRKAGFGLKIDDLPDHYALKKHVISWEKQFWVSKVESDVYDAEIDTTFAVYRQNTPYIMGPGLRTGGSFVARHEPWYINSTHPSDEIRYYRANADTAVGSWGITSEEVTDTYNNHAIKHSITS